MGTRQILVRCSNCRNEWYMTIEFLGPEEFRELADNETCPDCDSKSWTTTDVTRI